MNQPLVTGPTDHVDDLLESFFGKEMPDPWPRARVPAPADAAARPRVAYFPRLALAASILLILISYLTLAEMFPAESGRGLTPDWKQTIGSKPGVKRVPTGRGGEALLWEETIPGNPPTIIINVQQIRGPEQR